jgi:cytochrome c-type biogenesis protein CcmF
MDLGSFTLAWAIVPMALAMIGYLLVAAGAKQYRLGSRVIYDVLLGLVGISFIYLLILFLTDKFQYSYVASYSSRDLTNTFPHFFKLSALWAGQQGTFVLWLVYGLLLGLWVRSRAKDNEGWVMFFYILAQAFLLVLALVSKPFARLDFVPADGQGLNPLLQNYWMQIHPPIVFLGFAAACIPFAFAMAALATNKYDDWVRQTMPWAVFSVVTLGLGIFLGGYWAYETLGWGGYWSWDPVENASAIPWFVGIALVHGMVVEKARGSWRRMNLFLALALFLLIVYGTFLTRSGVLADFSVHSFTDLGYNNILLISLLALAAISFGLWGYRARKIKGVAPGNDILSQEFTTFLAVALLLPFTLLVLYWTSFPLISTWFSKLPLLSRLTPTPAAIATSYYNMAGLIFSVIFALILGFNALLLWKKTEPGVFLNKIIVPFASAAFASLIILLLGLSRIVELWSAPAPPDISLEVAFIIALYFLFFLASLFALITNLTNLIQRRGNWRAIGGYLSHVGFAILLLGIIISSSFGEKTKVTVEKDGNGAALGYNVKYTGNDQIKPKEERSNFELSRNGKTIKAYSISKEMARGGDKQYVRTPYIQKYLFSDLYLSLENLTDESDFSMLPFDLGLSQSTTVSGYTFTLLQFDSQENKEKLALAQPRTFEIGKGQSVVIDGRKITFQKFDMSQHGEGMASKVGALLDIENNGSHSEITPTYEPTSTGMHQSEPVDLPGGGTISLDAIIADKGAIGLSYSPDERMPDIKLGTILNISTDSASYNVTPVFDAGSAHGMESMVSFPDGGRLFLVAINARADSASYVLVPPMPISSATIEISTKPMINLVWLGFSIMVIGSAIAVIRRMRESRQGSA